MRWLALLAALGAVQACHSASPLRVETVELGDRTRLVLYPAAGVHINARVKPALELVDGQVVRFDSGSVDADSVYFTAPPTAELAGAHSKVAGRLRASICGEGERACRVIDLEL